MAPPPASHPRPTVTPGTDARRSARDAKLMHAVLRQIDRRSATQMRRSMRSQPSAPDHASVSEARALQREMRAFMRSLALIQARLQPGDRARRANR